MKGLILYKGNVFALFEGCKTWVPDQETLQVMQGLLSFGGKSDLGKVQDLTTQKPTVMRALGYVAGPRPPGVDVYGVK